MDRINLHVRDKKHKEENSYNPIFFSGFYLFILTSFSFAQQTYNLDVVFQKTEWDVYPDLDDFGISLAGGDLNGDGYSDAAIGAAHYIDTLNWWAIDIYVYNGSPNSVGSGGDLNDDGYEDLAVGADENNEAYFGAGKVSVFNGGNPMDTISDCWLHGEGVNHFLGGNAVSIINNSGTYDHLLTGTPFCPYGFPNYAPGKLYVLFGGALVDTIIDAFLRGDSMSNQQIGWHVASAGDVNADGRDEVMFSNYAVMGVQPSVWICKYTGPGIGEDRRDGIKSGLRVDMGPNPAINYLDLQLPGAIRQETGNIKVYDVAGREVANDVIMKGIRKIKLETKGWPLGVYFIKVQIGRGDCVKKVIKIK